MWSWRSGCASWQGQLRDLKGGAVFSFHSALELLLQLEALLEQ